MTAAQASAAPAVPAKAELEDMVPVIIGQCAKNKRETLRISLRSFKSSKFCDIRLLIASDDGDLRFTKKGLAVKPELLPWLISHLQRAEAEMLARGWLTPTTNGGEPK